MPTFDERSKLLRRIPLGDYERIIRRLQEARVEHPGYRDDELLIYICFIMAEGKVTP